MALVDYTIDYDGDGPALAAPTVSETIANVDNHTYLCVVVGGTSTNVTVVRPGNDAVGVAITDKVYSGLANVTRIFKVDRNYVDADTGLVTVNFSQVTAVTAAVLRG